MIGGSYLPIPNSSWRSYSSVGKVPIEALIRLSSLRAQSSDPLMLTVGPFALNFDVLFMPSALIECNDHVRSKRYYVYKAPYKKTPTDILPSSFNPPTMAGVNKVILVGNLGADPEIRHLQNGASVANFRIATSETYKDKTTGERREQTEWHSLVAWRGLAEITEKYLRKGSKVYVEGKLRTRQWQDKDGNTKYTTEIHVDELTMLDRASDNSGASSSGNSGQQQPQSQAKETSSAAQTPIGQGADDDDDLPF